MTAPAARIVALDALRGVAVVGIAWMNVYAFAFPGPAYYNPAAIGGDGPADYAVWAASLVLVEDKFRALFAMLFGAGVAIQFARGARWGDHFARMAVLFAIGIVHATVMASNDILRAYALAGLALPLARNWPVRRLWFAVATLMAVHVGASAWWIANESATSLAWTFGADPGAIAAGLARGQETFGERLARRLAILPQTLTVVAVSIPLNLSAMVAGVALWRMGLLAGAWPPQRALQFGLGAAALAVPVLAAWAWSIGAAGYSARAVAQGFAGTPPFDLLLGIGYAALCMAMFTAAKPKGFVRCLAAAGRLSLTNYVITSALFSLVFASWGFAAFGALSRWQALAVAVLPGAAMLAWSPLWLTRFRQGPLEYGWRRMATSLAGVQPRP